ncbi:hypothetical protein QWZ03_19155 [Chitinimonas viridis]|uniref:Flagellar hook-associated protein 2 C-terminal domain-containing protein n=1 Tax=Chitinimonas viridis TaxID=664880 RepID=A0ABT8B9H0_9NEIS|nr:flagellar filament capping protein FliD [Chitinimonas viridis]MDN3578889.1 hypothetical protein [Chitinimonas viridis]
MAIKGIEAGGFNYAQLNKAVADSKTADTAHEDFAVKLASFKAQAMGALLGSVGGNGEQGGGLDGVFGTQSSNSTGLDAILSPSHLTAKSQVGGLNPAGYNMALFDPQAGYNMMSLINNREVSYKAQYEGLSRLQPAVTRMQQLGTSLGGMTAEMAPADVKAQVQGFVAQYNSWIKDFEVDMQPGGALADSSAAKVTRHELEQNLTSPFNGAVHGVQGMRALGVTIDPVTHMASLDAATLDAVLAEKPLGVVATVREFAGNFAKSAELLNQADNFIPRQLDNLGRALAYIGANKSAWQAEFGMGDAAQPLTKQVAQALAAYKA